jgi:hypothetical protein
LIPIIPVFQYSTIPLFGAAGGATGGGAAAAGRARGTFKLASDGEGKGGHHPVDFLALTFRAGNLFGSIEH